jgi:hypothetical protein
LKHDFGLDLKRNMCYQVFARNILAQPEYTISVYLHKTSKMKIDGSTDGVFSVSVPFLSTDTLPIFENF